MRLALTTALLAAALGTAPARAQQDGDCAAAVDSWQDFAARENQGGHMDTSVFEKIQAEIGRASALCQAGQDAQARRAVEESRRRHGY